MSLIKPWRKRTSKQRILQFLLKIVRKTSS